MNAKKIRVVFLTTTVKLERWSHSHTTVLPVFAVVDLWQPSEDQVEVAGTKRKKTLDEQNTTRVLSTGGVGKKLLPQTQYCIVGKFGGQKF